LQTLEAITALYHSLNASSSKKPVALIEAVAYQSAVVEQLKNRDIETRGVKIHSDKRARLQMASPLFEQGAVFFPKSSNITLMVQQLVGFSVEKYDDLADAISMGLNYAQTKIDYQLAFMYEKDGVQESIYTMRYRD
jgi:predicted phage terminase large subunit-like protein